jgi:hypothetical protein
MLGLFHFKPLHRPRFNSSEKGFLEYWAVNNIGNTIEQSDLRWRRVILEIQVAWTNGEFLQGAAIGTTWPWLLSAEYWFSKCQEEYSSGKILWSGRYISPKGNTRQEWQKSALLEKKTYLQIVVGYYSFSFGELLLAFDIFNNYVCLFLVFYLFCI